MSEETKPAVGLLGKLRGCAGGCGKIVDIHNADGSGWVFTPRDGLRPDVWCPECGAKRRPAGSPADVVIGREAMAVVAINGHKVAEFIFPAEAGRELSIGSVDLRMHVAVGFVGNGSNAGDKA
jgi:hypothetical protein